MCKKIHMALFYHAINCKTVQYICNVAVLPSIDKLTMEKRKVTCKNCLKIIKTDWGKSKIKKYA